MVVKEYKKPAGVYKVQTFRTTQGADVRFMWACEKQKGKMK